MNSEERRLLSEFLDQLKQVRGAAKDPEAEALIREAAAAQPDAVYLLVQKALLQEQALAAAKARIAALESRPERSAAPRSGGFLSQDPWGAPARPASAAPWPAAAPAGSGFGGLGGFLGTAAAAAAGVAGGAFLFQGLENLLGHHDEGLFGGDHSSPPGESVVVNEFFGGAGADRDDPSDDADFDALDDGLDDFDDDTSV